EMTVDLDLLGPDVDEPYQPSIDRRLEIDPDARRVPHPLGPRLIESEHDAPLAQPRAFGNVLQCHAALAGARDADHERRAAEEIAAAHHLVEPWHAGRDTRGGVIGRRLFPREVTRGLDPAVDLEPLAIHDRERVPPHPVVLSPGLDDLDRALHRALHWFEPELDDRVG